MRNRWILPVTAAGILLVFAGCNKTATTDSGNSSSSATNSAANTAPATPAGTPAATPAAAPTPAPQPVVIPAGTELTVTLDQTVGTQSNSSGDSFAASLAAPVVVSGGTILPMGTRASGTVVQAEQAGHLKGGAVLTLTLNSVRVKGQTYTIRTSEFQQTGEGRGKRTAIGGGGGAAFGAIIGALAGGGKGAAIGAVAGGGAGTAGAAYTGNRDITLPAETTLHFRLKAPVSIQP